MPYDSLEVFFTAIEPIISVEKSPKTFYILTNIISKPWQCINRLLTKDLVDSQ